MNKLKAIIFAFLFLGLCIGNALAQTATLLPNGEQQFNDQNGQPYAGGRVYFYSPATTTPKNTWQDPFQHTLNTNPVLLNSAGRAIIYGSGNYRQILQDQFGNTIWDQQTQDVLATVTTGALAAVECCLPSGSISSAALAITGVIPGTYGPLNATVNAQGQITSASNAGAPVAGDYANLVGTSPGGVQTATWSAGEFIAETAPGGTIYKGTGLALSFNGATTGANGMDVGVIATAFLAVYAIYNPVANIWGTLGIGTNGEFGGTTLAPATYYGSHMPTGYTASGLLWTGMASGTTDNIIGFYQVGHTVTNPITNVLNIASSVPVSYTQKVLLSTSGPTWAAPPSALTVFGTVGSPTSNTASRGVLASDLTGIGTIDFFAGATTDLNNGLYGAIPFSNLQVQECSAANTGSVCFYYYTFGSTVPVSVNISGYTF